VLVADQAHVVLVLPVRCLWLFREFFDLLGSECDLDGAILVFQV
jgi:hypothetical protein